MKFNTRVLLGLVAASQLAIAAPIPQDSFIQSGAARIVNAGCVASGVLCQQIPHPMAKTVGGAVVAAGVTGQLAATIKDNPEGVKQIKDAAKAVPGVIAKAGCAAGQLCADVGKKAVKAAGNAVNKVSNAVTGKKPTPPIGQPGGRRRATNEFEDSKIAIREPEPLVEDSTLATREPESLLGDSKLDARDPGTEHNLIELD